MAVETSAVQKREVKIYGVNACKALARVRQESIIRVYLLEERLREFSSLLKWCSSNKLAYHIVTSADLEKITESTHHEGVCILARRELPPDFVKVFADLKAGRRSSRLLFLENIQNPHNLGAIARVCAHFGVDTVLVFLHDDKPMPTLHSASIFRTSEGALEFLDFISITDPVRALQALKFQGYALVGTSSHAPRSLFATTLPEKAVFLLGSEADGLSHEFQKMATPLLRVPGTGNVESMNVACAASVILAEHWRQHPILKAQSKKSF